MNQVSIHWDYENVPQKYIAKNLCLFAKKLGNLGICNVYTKNWETDFKAKSHLKNQGYKCINAAYKVKNAVDTKLALELGRDSSDIIILVSGDCYSQIIFDDSREHEKKVIIFARKGSECQSIKNLAEFYSIEKLPDLLKKEPSQITFWEAE